MIKPSVRDTGLIENGKVKLRDGMMAQVRKPSGPSWPAPLIEAALHGPAGELVRRLDPHTESDRAAILFQTLVGFGNIIGRTAHFRHEADRHFANMNCVLVGNTSKGRKGTSWGHVRAILSRVAPDWQRPASGLSTGEGLIWAVRDESRRPNKDGEIVLTDEGVADKRLLVMEPEFARVLQSTRRDGNTLSAVLRQCFDTGDLRIANKNSPALATGAHVSCIGHITKQELARTLTETECANGFGNRILWVCVQRSKELPEGGNTDLVEWSDIEARFKHAIEFAKSCGELRRDSEARELWASGYGTLSSAKPGLLGAVTSRAEAYVSRLSLVYAALDCSASVRRVHLEAGLAAWRYCEDSARFIFGDSLGDSVADEIRAALGEAGDRGLTRTDISDLFKRNRSRAEIERALALLAECGMARMRPEPTAGRQSERWFAT